MKMEFQLGTSSQAHKILKIFSGKADGEDKASKINNPRAPFKEMRHAYVFALMLGISRGEKSPVKNRINYTHGSSIEKTFDNIFPVIKLLGDPEDVESPDAYKKAIEEYTTWGLLYLDENYKFGSDDFRLAELFKLN